MTIIELTKKVKFKDVSKALRFHYPHPKINKGTMDRYKTIMEEISKYKFKEVKDKQLIIYLMRAYKVYNKSEKKWHWWLEEGEEYYSTSMKKKNDTITYAMEFTRWEISANWKIETKTLNAYRPAEIMAHYLWEVTFCGYTQAPIQKKVKGLNKMIKDIKKDLDKKNILFVE